LVLVSTGMSCNLTPKQKDQLVDLAGTALMVAATNFAGPYAPQIAGVINLFAGEGGPEDQDSGGARDDGAEEAPLALDVVMLRRVRIDGQESVAPIEDGDQLLDGRGDPDAGDQFGILFSASSEAYVYVVAIDATGWVQPLFPMDRPPYTNPVFADQQIKLPGEDYWYGLDQARGVETVYFMATRQRHTELEARLEPFQGQERPPAAEVEYRQVTQVQVIERGLTGIRPGGQAEVLSDAGGAQAVALTSFFSETGEGEFVFTRWFNHE
jgi:hypothetical protein